MLTICFCVSRKSSHMLRGQAQNHWRSSHCNITRELRQATAKTALSISTFIDGKCGGFPTCCRLNSGNFKPRTKAQPSFLVNNRSPHPTIKISHCRDNSDFSAFDLIFTGTCREWRPWKLFSPMPLFYRWARQSPEEYRDLLRVTQQVPQSQCLHLPTRKIALTNISTLRFCDYLSTLWSRLSRVPDRKKNNVW